MDKPSDVVKITSDLVNIRSQSLIDGESDVSNYIASYLKKIGIKAEITEFEKGRCSVIAAIGSGEGLLLNGHIDTVPIGDPKEWKYGTKAKIVGDKLYGRGTSDMKGGAAALLAALAEANLENPKRRLLLTFVGDEEVMCRGSEWLLKNRKSMFKNVKYGVIAEPTDLKMLVGQKGILELSVKVKGIAAHGSMPELGRNAIVDMSHFIEELEKLPKNFKAKDKMLGKGTINIGTIKGGTASNVVAESCEMSIDRRLVPGETSAMAISQIKKILDGLKLDYNIELRKTRPPFKLDTNSYIVKLVKSIAKAKAVGTTGYTEAELYNSLAGIDCVVFGPGTEKVIHKPNEYVLVPNLVKAKKYYSEIIKHWLSS